MAKNGSSPEFVEVLKDQLIDQACDPQSGLTVENRSLLALLSLPREAQSICTEQEREHVVRTVAKAMDAAVLAALQAAE